LALDAVYRFRNTPKEFKKDWLKVADDEVRDFKMIESLLGKLGYSYGDFKVHQGLFIAGKKSQNSLIERMALTYSPRLKSEDSGFKAMVADK